MDFHLPVILINHKVVFLSEFVHFGLLEKHIVETF